MTCSTDKIINESLKLTNNNINTAIMKQWRSNELKAQTDNELEQCKQGSKNTKKITSENVYL